MKESPEAASFSFQNYIIRKFSFVEPKINQTNVSVEFIPSGEYNTKEGIFKLILRFVARGGEKKEDVVFDLTAEGFFKFEPFTVLNSFPEYFYANSIAILYPYLRAFISFATSVGNSRPLILPTYNLSSLAEPLKENVVLK